MRVRRVSTAKPRVTPFSEHKEFGGPVYFMPQRHTTLTAVDRKQIECLFRPATCSLKTKPSKP